MTAAAIWSGGYGIEVLLDRLDDKLLLVPIQYVGITTVPVFWFFTAAQLTGRIRTITPRLLASALVIPVITVSLTATNSSHHLMWEDAAIVVETGSMSLEFVRGPGSGFRGSIRTSRSSRGLGFCSTGPLPKRRCSEAK